MRVKGTKRANPSKGGDAKPPGLNPAGFAGHAGRATVSYVEGLPFLSSGGSILREKADPGSHISRGEEKDENFTGGIKQGVSGE